MAPLIKVRVQSKAQGDITFAALRKKYTDLSNKHVTIGILDPSRTYPDSHVTVGEVALWQEFGTNPRSGRPKIPARSFLRSPFDAGLGAIFALKQRLLGEIANDRMSVVQALAALGADGVRRIQTTIKRRIPPPLAELTLEQRRDRGITGTIPLYATRMLYNSIHFAVRDNQSKD